MKRFICFIIFAVITVFSASASAAWNNDKDILVLLNELNIMVGDENGDYRLDDNVTRAEFSKLAINSSSAKNTVASGMKVSPFRDVQYTHWAAPYIKAAISAGIVEGYVDATFRPDNTVTYEEALTMMLKVLGYCNDDFGASWPYGQIGLAENLEMTKNMGASQGEPLTRGQVARLIYNTLDTKMKDSQVKLLTVFDCSIIEGVTVIASNNEDSSVGTDKIFTSAGTYDVDEDIIGYVGRRGDIIIKNGTDFTAFIPREQEIEDFTVTDKIGNDLVLDGNIYNINSNTTTYYKSNTTTYEMVFDNAEEGDTLRLFRNPAGGIDYAMLIAAPKNAFEEKLEEYVIYSQLADAVICYKNGEFSQIDIPDGTVCYKDDVRSTFATVKAGLEMGDILYIKRGNSGIDYVNYEKGNMEGPIKVTGQSWQYGFDTDSNTAVMRNGTRVSAGDIQVNDIVYYSSDLNMVLAYTDKVRGVYEKAAPTRDTPTSVTVSGKDYRIESVEAFNDLSSSGSLKYGDTVTLLLGRGGEVAGVAETTSGASSSAAAAVSSDAGYVIDAGRKDFTNSDGKQYSSYYVTVVSTDGTVNEYPTDKNCRSYMCGIVRVKFADGKADISKAKSGGDVYGRVSVVNGKIGNTPFAENINILDTSGYYNDDIPAYVKTYIQRVDGVTIDKQNVLYYSINGYGEVDELILRDVTGDMYVYGIVVNRDKTTGAYKIDIDGTQNTYMTSFTTETTGPYRFRMMNGSFDSMIKLSSYRDNLTSLSEGEAEIGTRRYLLSDNVIVYYRNYVGTYMKIPIGEAIEGNYKMTAYYDKAQNNGGRIRIIIAQDR